MKTDLGNYTTEDIRKELEYRVRNGEKIPFFNPIKSKVLLYRCGQVYKDGGTERVHDKKGNFYFIDGKIGSVTKGKVFTKYPTDLGAKIVDFEYEIVN